MPVCVQISLSYLSLKVHSNSSKRRNCNNRQQYRRFPFAMNNTRAFQTQYKQYEAKWTSWREKLLERREQMRKKREQQKQAAATKAATAAETDKSKNIVPNDDKILNNILSNSENQHLINNLIGIGKTLGLTGGKQQSVPTTASSLPPPPPPPPESTNSGSQPDVVATQGVVQQQVLPQQNMIGSNVATTAPLPPPPPPSSLSSSSSPWPNQQQQWENNQQYHPRMEVPPGYGMLPSAMHHHPTAPFAHPMVSPNFTQPPPNLPPGNNNNNGPPPNFSQPPPNYPPNNSNNSQERPVALQNATRGPANVQEPPPNVDMMRFARHPNDRGGNFDGGQQSNFLRRPGEPPDHRFHAGRGDGIANPSGNEQEQFMRSGDAVFGRPNEPFNDRIEAQQQRFRRGDRAFPGDFGNNALSGPMNFHSGNEGRFGPPMNERFTGGNNRFGPIGNDRFPPPGDRPFPPDHDRFGGVDRFSGGERFVGPEADKFGRAAGKEHRFDRPDNERFGANDRFERFPDLKDRFPLANERFGPGMNEHFGSNDRFGRGSNPTDCFDPKDAGDHRRDAFGANARAFGRNPGFSPPKELPPELRKLMEKRKAAGDVFRPSFLSDSEKISSVGSLSESFKKIAGDSPFRSSFDFPKPRPGGPPSMGNFAAGSSGRLTPPPFHPFAPDSAGSPYGHPRGGGGHPFSSNNSAHDNESPGPLAPGFRQGVFPDNFAKQGGSANYNERGIEKDMENPNLQNPNLQNPNLQNPNLQNPNLQNLNLQNPNPQNPNLPSSNLEDIGAAIITDSPNIPETDNVPNIKNTEMTQSENETEYTIVEQTDNPVIEDDLSKKDDDNKEGNQVLDNDGDSQQQQQQQQDNEEQSNSYENNENVESNTDNKDESVQPKKAQESLPFMGENDPRPEDLNIEPPPELPNLGPVLTNPNSEPQDAAEPFNEAFDGKGPPASGVPFHETGLREMKFPRMNAPFTGPFSGPPPLFNPRGPRAFLPDRPGGFQPQRHGDNAPLGPNDGQFGPNAPSDAGRFSPRRPNDGQYAGRDRSDELPGESPRNSNSGQFGPRNEPFGLPRGPIGKFGQVGLRGLVDPPFVPRNSGPFGPRGNDMPFRPRGGPNDTHRHPDDGPQFGFLGPNNNNRFGRPNEPPFDRRPPSFGFSDARSNEGSAFGPRGPNDSMLGGPRGPPPDPFPQGLRSPKSFNENRFDSRDLNDGPFGPDFKDRSLAAKGPMSDSSYTHDYVRRSGPYTRREQFKDDKFESPLARPDESFNRNAMDTEPRKDNVEYTRRMPPSQDPYKKDLDLDRRTNALNATQLDERSRLDPKIAGGYSGAGGNEATDSDRQSKFLGPNLFTKRPPPILPAGSGGGGPGEFCAPRQFNYNHGEIGSGEKKIVEYTPSKVIDYGHTSRPAVVDQHLPPPVQCFDYAHGDSKPVERHQHQSKKDFRNWVENEQSIKDYAEKMRTCYENTKKEYTAEKTRGGGYDVRRPISSDYAKQQRMKEHHMDRQQQHQQQQQANDRRPYGERERRENEERKERSSVYNPLEEQRLFFDRDSGASDQSQNDRNIRRGN